MPTTIIHLEPRWQRRAEARPQELLEAALAEFVARGYAATRLDEVARRAGVSKGTLYLYYENKAELFKAVVRQSLVANLDEAEAAMSAYRGGSRELLAYFLAEFTRRVSEFVPVRHSQADPGRGG
jgi:AcrR family transcriptional regulator